MFYHLSYAIGLIETARTEKPKVEIRRAKTSLGLGVSHLHRRHVDGG